MFSPTAPDKMERQKPRAAETRVADAMFAGHRDKGRMQEVPEIEIDARFTVSGNEVLRAMGRLDAGKAIVGGLGIVILAIVLDRISQGMGQSGRERGYRHWWQGGPVGLILRATNRTPKTPKPMNMTEESI